ncbi:MAG TPA: (2Fe-2S)-binding protein [Caldilineae bacterium]|nr:(2Fe-2S)-binding protein [Caldilineae bacterium]
MKHQITCKINDEVTRMEVESHRTLLDALREDLGLVGAKHACVSGECGSCNILFDGEVVSACMILAVEADGAEIITVEGLAESERLHALQKAFLDHNALQCGFCSSGMLVSSYALLQSVSRPNEQEIRAALEGNLCRCTGYADIIKAVQVASRARR